MRINICIPRAYNLSFEQLTPRGGASDLTALTRHDLTYGVTPREVKGDTVAGDNWRLGPMRGAKGSGGGVGEEGGIKDGK